jgi:hypothetical protein
MGDLDLKIINLFKELLSSLQKKDDSLVFGRSERHNDLK